MAERKKVMSLFKHYTHSGQEITEQQFWFIHYYLQTHNTRKAAEKAGINLDNSRHVLDNEAVLEELNYLEGRIQDKAEIDTARLYQELWQIAIGVQKDPFGFDIAPADRIKALTELLKRTDDLKSKEKMLKDNVIQVKITRDYNAIPTNEDSEESGDDQQ